MQAVAAMPESSCALYEIASQAVLEREGLLAAAETGMGGKRGGAATVNQLTQLLQAIFFEANPATNTSTLTSHPHPHPSPSPYTETLALILTHHPHPSPSLTPALTPSLIHHPTQSIC